MPLIEYGAEIWAQNQERDLAELNKPYKEYFANIRPEKDSFIPFTPSQWMILLELLALFDYNKKDRNSIPDLFLDPAHAPKITRSVTTQQLRPKTTISANITLLLYKRLSYWNTIPTAVREGTKQEFKRFVEENVLQKVISNKLGDRLKHGKVRSKSTDLSELFELVNIKNDPNSEMN